jgi:hypothetical protein
MAEEQNLPSLPPPHTEAAGSAPSYLYPPHSSMPPHSPRLLVPDILALADPREIPSPRKHPQHQPLMDNGGHQLPWPIRHDHDPSNGSIPKGYAHAISPSQANGAHYQAPTPPPGQQYPQPVTSSYAQPPYMTEDDLQAQQMRRRQVRATQACNHCRSRKQKCDQGQPCQTCKDNNFDCQYRDVPPPKYVASKLSLYYH